MVLDLFIRHACQSNAQFCCNFSDVASITAANVFPSLVASELIHVSKNKSFIRGENNTPNSTVSRIFGELTSGFIGNDSSSRADFGTFSRTRAEPPCPENFRDRPRTSAISYKNEYSLHIMLIFEILLGFEEGSRTRMRNVVLVSFAKIILYFNIRMSLIVPTSIQIQKMHHLSISHIYKGLDAIPMD